MKHFQRLIALFFALSLLLTSLPFAAIAEEAEAIVQTAEETAAPVEVPEPEAETPAPEAETPAPEVETAAPEAETPVPDAETPTPEAPQPEPDVGGESASPSQPVATPEATATEPEPTIDRDELAARIPAGFDVDALMVTMLEMKGCAHKSMWVYEEIDTTYKTTGKENHKITDHITARELWCRDCGCMLQRIKVNITNTHTEPHFWANEESAHENELYCYLCGQKMTVTYPCSHHRLTFDYADENPHCTVCDAYVELYSTTAGCRHTHYTIYEPGRKFNDYHPVDSSRHLHVSSHYYYPDYEDSDPHLRDGCCNDCGAFMMFRNGKPIESGPADNVGGYIEDASVLEVHSFKNGKCIYCGEQAAALPDGYPTSLKLDLSALTIGVSQSVQTAHVLNAPSGAGVTWKSSNSKIAKVDATSGKITGVAKGTATITACLTAYPQVTGKLSVRVVAKGKGVTKIKLDSSATLFLGHKLSLKAALTPSSPTDKALVWTSGNTKVATVKDGVVTPVKPGTAIITVRASSGLTAKCSVTVSSCYSALSLPVSKLTLGTGEGYTLVPKLTKRDSKLSAASDTVSFSSSSSKTVSVTQDGKIKALKTGTATITVKTLSGLSAKLKITVRKAPSKLTFSAPRTKIGLGESLQLTASLPKNTAGAIRYAITAPAGQKFASINAATGLLTTKAGAKTAGTLTVTASCFNGKKKELRIEVTAQPKSISFPESRILLAYKESRKLPATLGNGAAGAISYRSKSPEIVKIDQNGKITAASKTGIANIVATSYNGLTATLKVEVRPAATGLSLSAATKTIGVGETLALSVGLKPSNATSAVSFSSSSAKVVNVTSDGKITGLKTGTATITAKTANGKKASIKITVKKAPKKLTLSIPDTLKPGETITPVLKTDTGVNGTITLKSSKVAYVKVLPSGKLQAVACGKAKITATTYNGISVSKVVTVR